jgi:hypothetical protein
MTILEWIASFPGAFPPELPDPNKTWAQLISEGMDIEGGFETNIGVNNPEPGKVWRFADRVFVGAAAQHFAGNTLVGDGGDSWLSDRVNYVCYTGNNAQLLVITNTGKYAITGASRNSDNVGAGSEAIGVSGVVVNDKTGGSAWGLYSDIQHETGMWSAGLEVAAKNKGGNFTATPHSLGPGVYGIWLAGGGDDSSGGAPANPSNAAIVILKNDHTWNKGIVFEKDALTGCDGVTGSAVAVHLARGHTIQWAAGDGGQGGWIKSDTNTGGQQFGIQFGQNALLFIGGNGKQAVTLVHAPNAVNYVVLKSAATGAAPEVGASGEDANVDLRLSPKGAGLVVLGPYEAATNSIIVKDSAGTVRRLQCV